MANEATIHIAMFPWLAFGHILPFHQLSQSLAQRGHHISFISTPRNLQRLPKTPPDVDPLMNFIPLPMPQIENLPPNAESTADITSHEQGQFLFEALDALEVPLTAFLKESRPDWIIYDFATHWLPAIAEKLGIKCIYFNIFNASMVAFYGPASDMLREDGGSRSIPEGFMVPPKWVPFPSNLHLHRHEMRKSYGGYKSAVYRLGCAIKGCEFMAVRSCTEIEGEWLKLLEEQVCVKPIIPIGLLPPLITDGSSVEWESIKKWLDKQKEKSVVYIAFGSESIPSQNQVTELAHGLDLSQLPFFWALRKPSVLPHRLGFEVRVGDKGYVSTDWVPQLDILAHRSIGGFLTHAGWSSVIEGLGFGLPLILLPLSPPQALNARMIEEKKLGLEIPRDEHDGSFNGDSVAKTLRLVIVGDEGETIRANAQDMKELFGGKERNENYIDQFDAYLKKYKSQACMQSVIFEFLLCQINNAMLC